MLDKIDFDVANITKEEYKGVHDDLVDRLVVLQQRAHAAGIGLVVLFEGWNGAGKGGRISDLLYHLDARATSVHVTTDYDTKFARLSHKKDYGVSEFFPPMQQFWEALGSRGTMTIFDRGWYLTAIQRMLYGDYDETLKQLEHKTHKIRRRGEETIDSIESFEHQLADDGYIVVKFFLHISKKTQVKRLKNLAASPNTSWRVTKKELKHIDDYDAAACGYDRLLKATNFSFAPWVVLNAEDKRRANLGIVRTLVSALDDALNKAPNQEDQAAKLKAQQNSAGQQDEGDQVSDERSRTPEQQKASRLKNEAAAELQSSYAPKHSKFDIRPDRPTLQGVDCHLRLEPDVYKKALKAEQKKLYGLELEMFLKRIPLMIMYEGGDAAGKGGNIKRVAQALDARSYTIFPSPAPTKPELMHPHLWRYWTRLPKAGHVGIYDRSWYGRVLVERVEGFASPTEWSRAYDEINEFERDLTDWGAILLKFWVEIDRDEQLRRFNARANDPSKQWKITDEDWRNRDKYPQYRNAVEDMFRLTSTENAP
ncbi:MAG: polyphosphate--AMP phosphotransferase, partial [Eggerthellaceae bacterium]|nr:polyphosphate--AMP phosphotransferase [Eggerthellaceae bacterium]